MTIRMDQLIASIGSALDIVETEMLGATTNHGKRIAVLCMLMCQKLGISDEEARTIASCAFFHDNALTELAAAHGGDHHRKEHFINHCIIGQANVALFPFDTSPEGYVLYHHETANGRGLFGLREGEFPVGAGIIAAADHLDVVHKLQTHNPDVEYLKKVIMKRRGTHYATYAADALYEIMTHETLALIKDENIMTSIKTHIPEWHVHITDDAIFHIAGLISKIIDFHSSFTRKHSSGIANKAWLMSGYYGFDHEKRAKIYLAASLHDIGKLAIPNHILDKPGALDDAEFNIIKSHVYHSYNILNGVDGFEQIRDWASDHHEKLQGGGYYFGKSAKDLDFVSRLLAVTDIYQAVIEERPYHEARTHEQTMPILWEMAEKDFIDKNIVADFDKVLKDYEHGEVPPPDLALK